MTSMDPGRRAEIDDELRAHLDARIAYLVARGRTPEQARVEALRRFGDLEAGRAALYSQAAASARRSHMAARLGAFAHDVRYAIRSVWRQPAFAAGVIGVLALGIGVNLAVFGVADRVLLRAPAGVVDPANVWRVETTVAQPDREPIRYLTFSFPDVETLDAVGAIELSAGTAPRVVDSPGGPIALSYVDAAFFPLLGLRPAAGRFFDDAEGEPGSDLSAVVVSHDFWDGRLQRQSPGSATVTIADRSYPVIGVAPHGFTGLDLDPVDVWLPLGVATLGRSVVNGVEIPWYRSEMSRSLRVFGQTTPDAAPDAVTSRLQAALDGGDASSGPADRRLELRSVVPMGSGQDTEASRRMLARLAGVAAIVLIIAVANAMHLFLARGMRRQREVATRLALGASRGQVWRLLIAEGVVIALAAGVAAAVMGGWVTSALQALVFPDARWTTPVIDQRVLLFTAGISVLAGLAAGVVPAAQATSRDTGGAIRAGRAIVGRRARLARAGLLVAQTMLSLVLLVASGLLLASLIRLDAVRLGFEPDGLVSISLPAPLFQSEAPQGAVDTHELVTRLRADDSQIQVAFAAVAPLGATKMTGIMIPGSSYEPPTSRDAPRVNEVSAGYFATMGSAIVWGRDFIEADAIGEPVAVVNEVMAGNYWGGVPPPGACVLQYGSPCARVVGVVEDLLETPTEQPAMRYYLPLHPAGPAPSVIVVRTASSRVDQLATRTRAVLPAGQRVSIGVVRDRLQGVMRPWRTAAWLFSGLGLVALVLACAGIYSIVSYGAAERTHELGVRVALGSTRGDLVRLVLGGGLRLALLGGAAGVVVAFATARLLGSLLFDVSPFDVRVYVIALAAMTLSGVVAMLPAVLRASRVDVVVALRED